MMGISIRLASPEDWYSIAQRCEYATFFHTPLWHRLAVESLPGYRDASLQFELKSGVRAVFPLIAVGTRMRGLCPVLQSTFAGCYGGIIADGPITVSDQRRILRAVQKRYSFASICMLANPLLCEFRGLDGIAASSDYFTQWIKLGEGYEAVFSRFSKSNRERVRRANRNGVATRVASSLDEYRTAYDAYMECQRRWGEKATNNYPWRLFENTHKIAQEHSENIRLWLAEWEKKIIATGLVFYWNQHVVIWFSSSYQSYFSVGGNNALRADIIKDACNRGYKYFDFNPSGAHKGVVEFKDSFGAERQAIKRYSFDGITFGPLGRIVRIGSRVKRLCAVR